MIYAQALEISTYAWLIFTMPFVSIWGFWLLKRLIFDK